MTTFTDALNEKLPTRTAGALPSSRTNGMVTDALASEDVEALSHELIHTRAHYQSLEFMLSDEGRAFEVLKQGIADGEVPEPTTVDEAIQLALRFSATVALEAAYDTAHSTGFFIAVLGMDVQGALRQLYPHLDHSDPEREVSDDELQQFLAGEANG
ncbi:hypothetical protein SEA_BAJUNIPER_53 [Microbacterium phage BAjuniper]|nr:hypothetical protein SEA_BAJUNIPER_53 [Microbacterium phage BAjuniper]